MFARSRISTLSSKSLGYTLAADALGLHVNTSAQPAVAVSYGSVRSHSYTQGGVYQNWAGIEPATKGTRIWGVLDAWVNLHFNAGRKLILDLSGSPDWAVSAASTGESPYNSAKGNQPPDSWADYTDFVSAAATKYAGKVYAYDGWNEPNLPKYYGGPLATAAYLAQGQRLYYQAVKAADPAALVLAPPYTSVFGGTAAFRAFLAASDGAGGTGSQWFDHAAYHFYCNDASARPTGLERMYREVRLALNNAGRADAQVWAGEVGLIVPQLQTFPQSDRVALLRCYVLTLLALGVRRVLWFSFDGGGIGFGSGTDRAEMVAAWDAIATAVVGNQLISGRVYTTDQSTLTAELVTSVGTLTASVSGMPQ